MNYYFKPKASIERIGISQIRPGYEFNLSNDAIDTSKARVSINIKAYPNDMETYDDDKDTEENAANINLVAFDISKICSVYADDFDGFDYCGNLLTLMDDESGDCFESYKMLSRLCKDFDEANERLLSETDKHLYLVYLENIDIEPKFRNKGLATYIIKNLEQILYFSANIDVFAIVGNVPSEYKNLFIKNGYLLEENIDVYEFAKSPYFDVPQNGISDNEYTTEWYIKKMLNLR